MSNYTPPKEEEYRRNIPIGLRFQILRRDSFTCNYCGKSAQDVELEIDHLIHWSIVKKHEMENLVIVCRDFNRGKSNKIL